MSSSETPDSWDQREETTQPVAPMSKLNINAQSFVPGQNVFARSFAPTGVVAPTPTLAPVSGNSTESASASISTPDPAFNNPALLQQTETTEVSTSDGKLSMRLVDHFMPLKSILLTQLQFKLINN